jgi:hypothetical protein
MPTIFGKTRLHASLAVAKRTGTNEEKLADGD